MTPLRDKDWPLFWVSMFQTLGYGLTARFASETMRPLFIVSAALHFVVPFLFCQQFRFWLGLIWRCLRGVVVIAFLAAASLHAETNFVDTALKLTVTTLTTKELVTNSIPIRVLTDNATGEMMQIVKNQLSTNVMHRVELTVGTNVQTWNIRLYSVEGPTNSVDMVTANPSPPPLPTNPPPHHSQFRLTPLHQ